MKNNHKNFPNDRLKHYPSMISSPPNCLILKSAARASLRQTKVSFTYRSPPKLKHHHSCGARFSTIKFKNQHFPYLGKCDEGSLVKRVVKSKQRITDLIYKRERTPDKHNFLKDQRKAEKSQMNLFDKENKQNNQIERHRKWKQAHLNNIKNNAAANQQKKIASNSQKSLSSEQLGIQVKKKYDSASIELIRINQHIPSQNQANAINHTSNFKQLTSLSPFQAINKNYPALQPIYLNKAIKRSATNDKNNRSNDQRQQLLIFKLMLQQSKCHRQFTEVKDSAQDIFLAQSICDELQLNYDYCFIIDESDKSLSFHITL